MNSGTASINDVVTLMGKQVPDVQGIMSIFAGGVFWESVDQFFDGCEKGGEHSIGRLLELRAYSNDSEFHAIRDGIADENKLSWRVVHDDDFVDHLDDYHYLDIDAKQSDASRGAYASTGGGLYRLPVNNAEKIWLRNYLNYDANGLAYVADYRIVGLLEVGEQ